MGVHQGWVEVGERVWVRRYAFYDQNIGLILGDGAAAVIDTRSTYAQAREIVDHVREITPAPITTVIDTHGHFDHAYGNRVFRPCTIWGQSGCVPFMRRTGERRKPTIEHETPELAGHLDEIEIDPPDRTFDERTTIDVGGRSIELRFLGRGHTDHDAVITVPGTPVVWGGDLVEEGNVPFFGDGYPLDWVATARALARLVDPDGGVLVPGHGDHAGRAFGDAQADAIERLVAGAQLVHTGELAIEDAIAMHPFPEHPPEDARTAFERTLLQLAGSLDEAGA